MATVDSKTSLKIDELINATVVSGTVNAGGHLILTTRGGGTIDAGYVAKPFGERWSSASSYVTGDVVGYAGVMWKATGNSTNKPPALFTSLWIRLAGESSDDWAEKDPFFTGDNVNEPWQFFWKTGSPTVALTQVAGEFETGTQSLKITCPVSSSQRFYPNEENIATNGEVVMVTVRAKLLSTAAGARLAAEVLQNDAAGPPEPFGTGLASTASTQGSVALTTSWATYTFTINCASSKPRAVVNLIASTDATGSAIFLFDRVRISRQSAVLNAYPIGSVFISISSTNPTTLFGGTWVAWGTGRVPVGFDSAQTEFNVAEKASGAKTTTLTRGQIPTHAHTIAHDHSNGALGFEWQATTTTGGAGIRITDIQAITPGAGTNESAVINVPAFGAGNSGVNSAAADLGGDVVTLLQPSITCYMWKRTA